MGTTVRFGTGPFFENSTYTGSDGRTYRYSDGCFLLVDRVDQDTVDGYSRQAISDGTALDADGNVIPVGSPIIQFIGPDGVVVNSKDCTELDEYAVRIVAADPGFDATGAEYAAGEHLIELPTGEVYVQGRRAPAVLVIAGTSDVDDAGNAYAAGNTLLKLSDGSLVCVSKRTDANDNTQDGYALNGVTDGVTHRDRLGNLLSTGLEAIHFYDAAGNYVNSKDCTDINTYAVPLTANLDGTDSADNAYAAGAPLIRLATGEIYCMGKAPPATLILAASASTDDAGNAYAQGDFLLRLSNGDLVCVSKTADTDTVDGFAIADFADGATHRDAAGNLIPAGYKATHYFNAAGNYVNSASNEFVNSVTGDGVDATSPFEPAITQTQAADQGDNVVRITNFDNTFHDAISSAAFSFDADGRCVLTLNGKNGVPIDDTISVEVVLVNKLGDGTWEVTGTNGQTCRTTEPAVSWTPADVNDASTWSADPANPNSYMSVVQNGTQLCGFMLAGAPYPIPKPAAHPTHASSDGSVLVTYDAATNHYDYRQLLRKELYGAGETLPAWMAGTVDIMHNGATITVQANSPLPADYVGAVFVDEIDGESDCIPNKSDPVILETEIFGPDSTLPADMDGSVTVCLTDNVTFVTLNAGDAVPTDILGKVIVDEVSHEPAFTKRAVKPTPEAQHAAVFEEFNAAIHTAGSNVQGAGTSADPFRFPLPVQPRQELYCSGSNLPAWMTGSIEIAYNDELLTVAAGDPLPDDLEGCIFVDEVTGLPDCIPNKSTPIIMETELFKAGDKLPADMLGSIAICYKDPADSENLLTLDLEANDTIPATISGCVIVDEVSKFGAFTQSPVKVTPHSHIYVDYDADLHSAGQPVVGDGGSGSPFQVPLFPVFIPSFVYVDFDPEIHGETNSGNSVVYGDGSTNDPFQILRPCCDEGIGCEDVSATSQIGPYALPGCTVQTVPFDVQAQVLARGSEGSEYQLDDRSTVPATVSIPVPAAAAGSIMVLHVVSGADDDFVSFGNSTLGQPAVAQPVPSANTSSLDNAYSYSTNYEVDTNVFITEAITGAAGSVVDITWPNNTQPNDPLWGVINWHWVELSRVDGQPLAKVDLDLANSLGQVYAGPISRDSFGLTHSYATGECPALLLTTDRHVAQPASANEVKEITDADWVDFQVTGTGNELYDTVSVESANTFLCQLGMGALFLEGNSSVNIFTSHNIDSGSGNRERNATFALPIICEKNECVADGVVTVHDFVIGSPDCDRQGTKEFDGSFDVVLGAGTTSANIIPVINGTPQTAFAQLVSSTGTEAMNFSYDMGVLAAGSSTDCSVEFLYETEGDATGTSVTLQTSSITLSGVAL